MKKISDKYTNATFDNIKHIDDYGNEFWFAREIQKILEYKDWRNFQKVIDKAVRRILAMKFAYKIIE